MDVARHQKSTTPRATSGKRSTAITPAYKGPRRLAFRIRRRGFTFEGNPSLLIIDRYGVWSVTHHRYIRKTSYHRFRDLKMDLHPIRGKVRSYRMMQWPQYRQDEELRSLCRRLADLYWFLMPEETKETTVLFYRHRQQRRLNYFTALVVLVALEGLVLISLVLVGSFSLRIGVFLGMVYLALLFLVDKAGKECGL